MPSLRLGLGLDILASNVNPFPVPSLQSFASDLTVIEVSGSYYFKALVGSNLLITGYDFPAGWTKGFPLKSSATIDVFGQTGVPVTSLFQNFDFADQFFTKQVAQVVDGNGVETSEAYVSVIVAYSAALTGADLTAANAYFSPPAKLTTNVLWSATNGNDTTGNGTEVTPYRTLTKSGSATKTTLSKSATYKENGALKNLYIANSWNLLAYGFCFIQQTDQTYIVLFAAGAGKTASLKNYMVDAETKSIALKMFGDTSVNTIQKVLLKNFVDYGIRSESIATSAQVITNVIFSSNCVNAINCGSPMTITACYFDKILSGSAITSYAANAAGTFTLNNSKAVVKLTSASTYFLRLDLLNQFDVVSWGNKIKNITLSIGGGLYCLNQKSVDIQYNIIEVAAASTLLAIGSSASSGSLTSSKNHIKHNTILSRNKNGYGINVGAEATGAGNNKLEDIQIESNNLFGPLYYTPAETGVGIHGLFVGFQNLVTSIKYNKAYGYGIGIITKGSNTNYSNTVISYNVVLKSQGYGLYFKGTTNNRAYNLTLINNATEIYLTQNTGSDGAINNTVENCIVINEGGLLIWIDTASNSGNVLDYNIYYSDQAKPFKINTTTYSFAEWQALGFDAHSVMLPTLAAAKALFIDYDNGNYALAAGSAAIGAGVDLTATYNAGLGASTAWGDDTVLPVIVTKQQGANWDCGAYIH